MEKTTITSIKGFDSNLSCRGFQFEIDKTYSVEGDIKACNNGFHACPTKHHPLSVFEYYPPAGSRFAEVVQSGNTDSDGNKLASATITISDEISLGELTERAVKWVFDRVNWTNTSVANGGYEGAQASGYQGAAQASGVQGAAQATGDQGAATASGYQGAAEARGRRGAAEASAVQGAAQASGVQGAAQASGTRGAAQASGKYSHATATGPGGRVMAAGDNMSLCAREFDADGKLISIASGIVGIDPGLKPDTWYQAKGGKLVEVTS